MAIIVPNVSEKVMLDWLLKDTGGALKLRLYTNALTPVATSVTTDFTEATFTGYAAKSLARVG